MSVEEMTLEQLAVAACTADSSRPHLREAAQAYLDRIGFKSLADQWAELERELAEARAEVARMREALTELRRWVGDGDCSDDKDIWPGYATTAYLDAVQKADEALEETE